MGREAFRILWERRADFEIVLLLRPSRKNRKEFGSYAGDVHIVWGDVLNPSHVSKACQGIDACLHPLALISPEADRNPELAMQVNLEGTRSIVEAIEAQDPEHIRLVYINTIASYGDRLPPMHMGRTGDPVVPSLYDHYALTKIGGELAVMQSRIRHRVSLRQTFIMIPGLFSLMDPIMFHQPIHNLMECITARDSGRLLASCLDVPDDSDFWGNYYNIGGGPSCRTSYLGLLDRIFSLAGIAVEKVMDRSWFALKNFHMMYYQDAGELNRYLGHWEGGQDLEAYYREVWQHLPAVIRASARLSGLFPPYRRLVELIARRKLLHMAHGEDGTLRWRSRALKGDARAMARIRAAYGSMEAMDAIPPWGQDMPPLGIHQPHRHLDHGYDESKAVLGMKDLHGAAAFRGGRLESPEWAGDMHGQLSWECHQGHAFELTPHAMLKGGHWCPRCIAYPGDHEALARGNPFAAQVLRPPR